MSLQINNLNEFYALLQVDMGKIRDEIKQCRSTFDAKLTEAFSKIECLETENKKLLKHVNHLNYIVRKNNFVLFGADNNNEDILDTVNKILNKYVNITLSVADLKNIYRLNTKKIKNKSVPIKIELVSYVTKQKIFKLAKNFKDSPYCISDDLSPEERENRKKLKYHANDPKSVTIQPETAVIFPKEMLDNITPNTSEEKPKKTSSLTKLLSSTTSIRKTRQRSRY